MVPRHNHFRHSNDLPTIRRPRRGHFRSTIDTAPTHIHVLRIASDVRRHFLRHINLLDVPPGEFRGRIRFPRRQLFRAKFRRASPHARDQDSLHHRVPRPASRALWLTRPPRLLPPNHAKRKHDARPAGHPASPPFPQPAALLQPLRRGPEHPPRQPIPPRTLQKSVDHRRTPNPRPLIQPHRPCLRPKSPPPASISCNPTPAALPCACLHLSFNEAGVSTEDVAHYLASRFHCTSVLRCKKRSHAHHRERHRHLLRSDPLVALPAKCCHLRHTGRRWRGRHLRLPRYR